MKKIFLLTLLCIFNCSFLKCAKTEYVFSQAIAESPSVRKYGISRKQPNFSLKVLSISLQQPRIKLQNLISDIRTKITVSNLTDIYDDIVSLNFNVEDFTKIHDELNQVIQMLERMVEPFIGYKRISFVSRLKVPDVGKLMYEKENLQHLRGLISLSSRP
jgi:hypothetical protein